MMDFIPLIAVVVVGIVEIVLSSIFSKPYFTIGLPLFRCTINCFENSSPPTQGQLAAALPKSRFHSFVFSQLDAWSFAFRERTWGQFFRFSYTPVMHGSLYFDGAANKVRVVGLANWFPLAFVVLFAVTIPASDAIFFAVFLASLLIFIYAIQAKRFREVAKVAAECWGRPK